MSEASRSAHVRIIVADYAVVDGAGKITMVGAGIAIAGINPLNNMTAPFAVVAIVSFDPKLIDASPAVEMSLETHNGQLVQLPGHPPLRVGTSQRLTPPTLPDGVDVPRDAVRPKVQILMQFQSGLPLQAGHAYVWRVKVDHEEREEWSETLYVPDSDR
jgi:hypothetical protein